MCVVEENVDENETSVGREDRKIAFGNGMDGQAQDFCVFIRTNGFTLALLLVVNLLYQQEELFRSVWVWERERERERETQNQM